MLIWDWRFFIIIAYWQFTEGGHKYQFTGMDSRDQESMGEGLINCAVAPIFCAGPWIDYTPKIDRYINR
jgi:hypothetical protein